MNTASLGTALVTLGRLPVALEVVRALRRLHYRVLVADPLPVHLCRLSRDACGHRPVRAPATDPDGYLDDLVKIVERDRVSLVVPVSEEILHVARLQQRTQARVLCSSHDTLLTLHDKLAFARLCEGIDVPVPTTVRAHASDALCAHSDWVQKPRLSCSGNGVRFGSAGEPAALLPGTVVQARIEGDALCTLAFARRGRIVCQVGYRNLLASGSVSVRFEAVPLPDEVSRLVARVVEATAFSGMIAFDLLQDARAGWLPIECNPRATSGLHLFEPAAASAAFHALIEDAEVPGDACVPPELESVQAMRPGTRRQAFWSALLELQSGLLRGRRARGHWAALFTVRDIVWQSRDPLPFLMMTPGSAPLLWRALRSGQPISEIATCDVGWYEVPSASP